MPALNVWSEKTPVRFKASLSHELGRVLCMSGCVGFSVQDPHHLR
jgi:hypothetical protein